MYNTATHQCTVVPNATNPANFPNVITPNSTVILQSHPNDVNCPASAPYYNGKTCIACSAPTPLFSLVTLNCAACEAPKVYNSLAHQCELTNNNYVTNPNAQNLLNDGLPTNYWNQQSTTAMAAIPAPKVCPT